MKRSSSSTSQSASRTYRSLVAVCEDVPMQYFVPTSENETFLKDLDRACDWMETLKQSNSDRDWDAVDLKFSSSQVYSQVEVQAVRKNAENFPGILPDVHVLEGVYDATCHPEAHLRVRLAVLDPIKDTLDDADEEESGDALEEARLRTAYFLYLVTDAQGRNPIGQVFDHLGSAKRSKTQ